jgi:hypothetical protein
VRAAGLEVIVGVATLGAPALVAAWMLRATARTPSSASGILMPALFAVVVRRLIRVAVVLGGPGYGPPSAVVLRLAAR